MGNAKRYNMQEAVWADRNISKKVSSSCWMSDAQDSQDFQDAQDSQDLQDT